MNGVRRIAVLELLGGLGDVVIALPMIRALAASHPEARLDVVTFAPGDALLRGDRDVDAVRVVERGEPAAVADRAAAVVRRRGYDLVVCDARYGRLPAALAAAAPGAAIVDDLWRDPPPDERIADRFVALLAVDGLIDVRAIAAPTTPLLRPRAASAAPPAARRDPTRPPDVLIAVDARMAIKRWPTPAWRGLAGRLAATRGARVGSLVGTDPAAAYAAVAGLSPGGHLVGPLPLPDVIGACAAADLVIAADTGIARIAAATGTPTVALFGPTSPERFGLGPPHADVATPVPCPERDPLDMTRQACWWPGGRCVFAGRRSCVDDLGVATVLAAALTLLDANAGGSSRFQPRREDSGPHLDVVPAHLATRAS